MATDETLRILLSREINIHSHCGNTDGNDQSTSYCHGYCFFYSSFCLANFRHLGPLRKDQNAGASYF